MKRTFGRRLKELRKKKGITQGVLAQSLNKKGPTYISRLENDVRKPRSRDLVLKLGEELQLTVEQLDELLLLAGFNSVNQDELLIDPVVRRVWNLVNSDALSKKERARFIADLEVMDDLFLSDAAEEEKSTR